MGYREQEAPTSISFSSFNQTGAEPSLRLVAGCKDKEETLLSSEKLTDVQGKCHSPLFQLFANMMGKVTAENTMQVQDGESGGLRRYLN